MEVGLQCFLFFSSLLLPEMTQTCLVISTNQPTHHNQVKGVC